MRDSAPCRPSCSEQGCLATTEVPRRIQNGKYMSHWPSIERSLARSTARYSVFKDRATPLRGLSGAPGAGAVRAASPPVETGHMNLRDTGHSVKSCIGKFRWNSGGLSPLPLGLKPV
jgi:hypothetical protein